MKKILLIVLLLITFGCKTKQIVTDLKTNIKTDSISKVDSSVVNKTKLEKTIKIEDNSVIQISDSFNLNIIKYEYINGDTSKIKSKTITTNKTITTITEENKSLKEIKIKSDSTFRYSLKYLKKKIIKAKKEVKEKPWYILPLNIISIISILGIIYFIIFKL